MSTTRERLEAAGRELDAIAEQLFADQGLLAQRQAWELVTSARAAVAAAGWLLLDAEPDPCPRCGADHDWLDASPCPVPAELAPAVELAEARARRERGGAA